MDKKISLHSLICRCPKCKGSIDNLCEICQKIQDKINELEKQEEKNV